MYVHCIATCINQLMMNYLTLLTQYHNCYYINEQKLIANVHDLLSTLIRNEDTVNER